MKKLAILLMLSMPASVQAAAEADGGDMLAAGFKVLAALVVVIGLMLLVYALSRRGLKMIPGQREGRIKVVETRGLGPRKGLFLVRVRERELLLGVSADRIELLCDMGASREPDFDKALHSEMESPQ